MRALVAAVLLTAVCLPVPARAPASEPQLRVIVHRSRAGELRRSQVRAIFLRQKLFWDDGQAIVPINLQAGSEARERFSKEIFGQNSRRLAAFWNRRYFEAGEFPPATLGSEEAVVRFVAGNANAIGYVLRMDVGDEVAVALIVE